MPCALQRTAHTPLRSNCSHTLQSTPCMRLSMAPLAYTSQSHCAPTHRVPVHASQCAVHIPLSIALSMPLNVQCIYTSRSHYTSTPRMLCACLSMRSTHATFDRTEHNKPQTSAEATESKLRIHLSIKQRMRTCNATPKGYKRLSP